MTKPRTIKYSCEHTPTLARFHRSDARRRLVIGPVGSGKSTACCVEIFRRASEQHKGPSGLRRSRWAVIRNTYRELADTTVKTWLDWFPEDVFGRFGRQDMTHRVRFEDIELDVLFRALDRPEDIKKLLSLELTGAWVNESREVPKAIFDTLDDRIERFPAQRDGGCAWSGLIADTNPPDDDHWIYRLAEVERPAGWAFFKQPGGLVEVDGRFRPNPRAENLPNLPDGYYVNRQSGKSSDYIRVYYCSQYGFVRDGRPVYPEFVDATHTALEPLAPIQGLPVFVGIDFGLTPAATFGQRLPNGRWLWFDELVTEDMGAVRFAELLGQKLMGELPGFQFEIFGDPSGDIRAQTDERTPFQILRAAGIDARPTHTNDALIRREAVAMALNRMIDGKPGLALSPACKILRKGMAGGYCYRRLQVAGDERYHDKPDKNRFSHVCEAAQYMMLGAGEGRAVVEYSIPTEKPRVRPPRYVPGGAGWMGA